MDGVGVVARSTSLRRGRKGSAGRSQKTAGRSDPYGPPVDRPHEAGVDPPTTPEEVKRWEKWVKTLSAIQMRVFYRLYWEKLERAAEICKVIQVEAQRRYEAGEMDWQGNEIRRKP